ncbi:MAG: hypothetical protein NZM35_02530 [Chitinophagales bacterium]|nr:hypothetical protein [Chitinophagales bacterium]MDW8417916.1 hypothetical protein [Chitinophagales bacterium]
MRLIAHITSWILHPLLFPTYGLLLILLLLPGRYGYFGDKLHVVWLILVVALTFVFPAVWLLMMKQLAMIQNLELPTNKERIIPFVAVITFYLWSAWMFKPAANMKIPPDENIFLMLSGASISAFIAFFINVFTKISLHALGAGNLVALFILLTRLADYDLRMALPVIILLAGLTGTARLLLNAHTPAQVYSGYLAGFTGQFIAFTILPITGII